MWTVTLSEEAIKDLRRLSHDHRLRILTYVRDRIPQDPIHFSKRLVGTLSNVYRFRVGDYRLLAHINTDTKTVLIVHVGHRRDVYES
jgi:mRNA interferase RelE/StbE